MFKKIKKFFHINDEWKNQKFDFKGQSYQDWYPKDGPKTYQNLDEDEPPLQPQSREVRMKNLAYVGIYGTFSVCVVLLIIRQTRINNIVRGKAADDYRANYNQKQVQENRYENPRVQESKYKL